MKAFKDIDAYIKFYPKNVQTILRKVRATIKKSAPGATDAVSYGIPTFKLNGNLVHFGAFKDHISFFPTSSGVKAFQKELTKYKTSKGTIQFPLDKPVPFSLITKIVKFRVKENLEKNASSSRHTVYHKDGSLWAKGKTLNGKPNGYFEWFRKDGTKMRSGHFKKGVQVGEWITYDKKGKIYKVTRIK